ncbi:hypothetical protein BEP19_03380 [Ammoniphilus oxalaticus]|uniref:PepSY domain-containing protein n=1 Tax=Ammoniphilus oxalaticus TaxID=66863 RepID=A0A419SNU7_9BACL|nr:PepSY domain-containing protein [Ammoniphilus oxalaticus]RKD25980.1 hypothetical protein BEP19_03380 [Ammoniphilus oxalaticus]
MIEKWALPAFLFASLLVACSSGQEPANPTTETEPIQEERSSSNPAAIQYEDIKFTPQQAYQAFLDQYPEAKVDEIELEPKNGSYQYEVEGYDEQSKYEIKFNPQDGSIMKQEQKQEQHQKTGAISLDDVNKIQALIDQTLEDAGPEYRIFEWKLKMKNGKSIFEIEVVDEQHRDIEYKYDVAALTLIEKD